MICALQVEEQNSRTLPVRGSSDVDVLSCVVLGDTIIHRRVHYSISRTPNAPAGYPRLAVYAQLFSSVLEPWQPSVSLPPPHCYLPHSWLQDVRGDSRQCCRCNLSAAGGDCEAEKTSRCTRSFLRILRSSSGARCLSAT